MTDHVADIVRAICHDATEGHAMPAKGSSFWVFAFGYLILAPVIMNVGFDLHRREEWWLPQDMGTVVGEVALILLGLIAQTIGQSIRKLEKRLDEIDAKGR
jgi:hypothetical protein